MDYVTSDLHLYNDKVAKQRGFKTPQEHVDAIINGINSRVTGFDTLYVLGDIGNSSLIQQNGDMKRLKAGKLILIRGNHDKNNNNVYHEIGFDEVYRHPIFYDERIILSHYPTQCDYRYLNVHGHLHGAHLDLPNYINANIDETGYLPLSLKHLRRLTMNLPPIKEKFLHEWFAEHYVFNDKNRSDITVDETGHIVDIEKCRETCNSSRMRKEKGDERNL